MLRACVIVGDETVLARHLDVSAERVAEWLIGTAPIPIDKFLRAVDIVLAHNLRHLQPGRMDLEKYEHLWSD